MWYIPLTTAMPLATSFGIAAKQECHTLKRNMLLDKNGHLLARLDRRSSQEVYTTFAYNSMCVYQCWLAQPTLHMPPFPIGNELTLVDKYRGAAALHAPTPPMTACHFGARKLCPASNSECIPVRVVKLLFCPL